MEFAVSRALKKFRDKQYPTTICDESSKNDNAEVLKSINENNSDKLYIKNGENIPNTETTNKNAAVVSVMKVTDESLTPEGEYTTFSKENLKGSVQPNNRFLPRYQQSLDIPWAGSRSGEGDDDSKSNHSYRSTSRVSSRRQSTEESIDSEDEWYCHEMRKLSELEKQSEHLEKELHNFSNDVTLEVLNYQPNSNIKEKMTIVLQELKLKTKLIEPFSDHSKLVNISDDDKNLFILKNEDQPTLIKPSESVETIFARVTDYHTWTSEGNPNQNNRIVESNDASSGDTSGPDSPYRSHDDSINDCKDEIKTNNTQSLHSNNNTELYSDKLNNIESTNLSSVSVFDGWGSEIETSN